MLKFGHISQLDKHISLLTTMTDKQIFLVWGAVRDLLMGMHTNPIDIDATCAADPQDIFSSLQKHADSAVWLFRTEKFGTATMLIKDADDITYSYEITPFREEGWYTDRRHPDEITRTSSLLSDAGRRDFTMNALYYTSVGVQQETWTPIWDALVIDSEQVIDQLTKQWWSYLYTPALCIIQNNHIIQEIFPEGQFDAVAFNNFCILNKIPYDQSQWIRIILDPKEWLQDMLQGRLRAVWDPDRRFSEDALRMLRALRFVNIWNQKWVACDFHKETRQSIKKHYHLIQYIAKERIHDELVKVFSANNPFGYVALLDEANMLQYIFPALHRCKHNDQPIRYHPFDTYTHTLLTLWHVQQINTNYLVKLWMLYHDVGKPDQYYYYAQCKTKEELEWVHASWANHIVCWAEYAKRDFLALGFSTKEADEIAWYVAMHMRPWQILDARDDNQRKKVRVLFSEYWYDRLHSLFDICRSDRLGQYNPIQSAEIGAVDILYEHLNYLRDAEGQFTMQEMIVDGDDVMKEFGLPPSKEIGDLLKKAFQRVLHEKESRNTKHAILSYLRGIVTHGS